jgi:glycerophosphoryl diester phosphodiesterase
MYTCDHELRLYGHRGASALAPENTLEAFGQALADGATALELDIHRTVDGQLVVAHDPDGSRMAGSATRICDCTLDEVKAWDVGRGFDAVAGAAHAMPTLNEVIDAFPRVPISVDLKPNDPRAVAELLHHLRAADAEHLVTIGSFHDRLVYQVRRLGYTGPTALTRGEVAALRLLPLPFGRRMVRGNAAMIPRTHGLIRLDSERFIARCRRLGLRVDYWVVNDPRAAHGLLARGATGIVTDDPQRIAPVVAEFDRVRA